MAIDNVSNGVSRGAAISEDRSFESGDAKRKCKKYNNPSKDAKKTNAD